MVAREILGTTGASLSSSSSTVNTTDSVSADRVVSGSGGSGGGGAGMGTKEGGVDPLSLKLLGARLPHGEALAIRLDFIGFVVSKSRLELTFGLVETLWRDFLKSPLCGKVHFDIDTPRLP